MTFTKKILASSVFCALLSACATSPTGRNQILLYSESQLAQMGSQAFTSMKSEIKISNKAVQNSYVSCVAAQITPLVPASVFSGEWEVVVFDDPQINAFALPGGKIGVYTGILELASTQDQLAAIIGHEVGHVIAKHGNERASTSSIAGLSQELASKALDAYDVQSKNTIMAALGVGIQYGALLPFSRTHESEADLIGLELMSKAGFNPEGAVQLWQNMAKATGGKSPAEWMSTHPSADTRIKDLQRAIPAAMKLYEQSGKQPRCKQ